MTDRPQNVDRLAGGDIQMWVVELTTLHMKCVTRHGDPVELGDDDIRELIDVLQRRLREIEAA